VATSVQQVASASSKQQQDDQIFNQFLQVFSIFIFFGFSLLILP